MHVKAKQVAFLGVLAAVVSILIVMASVIETNTLFLLAAAAFLVGVAVNEFGNRIGFAFFIACILLGFLLSPNKLYVLTYTGFSFYILCNELLYTLLARAFFQKHRKVVYFLIKLVVFNLIYLPVLFIFPKLLFTGDFSSIVLAIFAIVGQLAWFLYDKAYEYFQKVIWKKFRSKIYLLKS